MSSDESMFDGGDDDSVFSESIVEKPTKKAAAAPAKKAAAPRKPVAPKTTTAAKKRAAPGGSEDESGASKKPRKAPVKKAAPKAKTKAKDSDDDDADALDFDDEADEELGAANGKKKASDTYQKLTQLEHILKRPDTYIGSVEQTEKQMWVFDSATENMAWKTITMVPGLYKIFDEILVNAADNKIRDAKMDTLKVTIEKEKNEVSVYNNGRGIPVELHDKEKIWVPELIFGHLLTSSNYDDDEKKVTGGRNGYGAKLCNIFSTEFTLETAHKDSKKKYKQTWTNNMGTMGKAAVTSNGKGEEYTRITFKPDLAKFGMSEMDQDLEDIIKRRVYDMAGTIKNVKVFLNGQRIVKVKNFKAYCEMYVKALREESDGDDKMEIIHAVVNDRWEIAFAVSNGSFQQVSFVNSIATTSGGTHVNYVADQLCAKLETHIKRKNKTGAAVKNAQMRNHFFLFVNCLIENPAFTSQTKEQLTTKVSAFGSKCELPEDFVKKIVKTEVINNIIEFANMKADKALKRADGGRRTRIHNPNLTDANKAGTKHSDECVLILTEGLSASGMARTGIASISGHDRYGVFPLRGKVLNVRDASHDQIAKNAEITQLKQILGLKHKQNYETTKDLRYGHIMIMTDQDYDGSHIKGLLINFFEAQFPSLLKIPNFLIEFITPIVKVYKGNLKKPTKQLSFFTLPEYEYWKEQNQESGWRHKYYKGLGTSGDEDSKIYFADLDKHMKYFEPMKEDGKKLIELAFSKSKADERKEWLRTYVPGTYLDHSVDMITYPDFVNKELILFSVADCARSIPSVVDGLKPGQRKILFGSFKRNLKNEIKVVQLAGYVSEHTGYQHGEVSLQSTITAMAQVFAGSNNVNLLDPSGNFGSRLQGGKDAASARYIYTSLSPFARKVLPPHDDRLLKYQFDDGDKIEPEWYVPVVPMLLVNGTEGIGTGWSSSIPSYNPEDIVDNLRRLMDGKELETMTPWYRGWTGTIEKLSEHRFKFSGAIRQINELQVEVTELPIKMWTQNFKEKLEEIIKGEKTPSFIKDYVDYNSPSKVHFIITMNSEAAMQQALDVGLVEKFKLSNTVATTNLVAFDPQGRINRYNSVEDILKEFYLIRLKFYQKRKEVLLVDLNLELQKLSNQARFIQMIIKKELIVAGKKRPDIIAQLQKHNFQPFSKKKEAEMAGETEPALELDEDGEAVEEESAAAAENPGDSYNYLLGMAIWTLTWEKAQKLLADVADKEKEIEILMGKSPKDLWKTDLEEFITEWRHQLEEDIRLAQTVVKKKSGGRAGAKGRAVKGKGKKKDDDTEDEYDASPKRKKAAPAKKQTTLPFAAERTEKKPAARAAAKKPPIILDDDDALDDSDFDMLEVTAPKKAPQPVKPKAEPVKPKADEFDDDDLDFIHKFETTKKVQPKAEDKEGDDFATADEGPTTKSEADDSDLELLPNPKAKPVPKKAAASVKSEDVDSDSDLAPRPKAKPVPKKAAASAKPTAKPKTTAAAKAAPKAKPVVDLSDYDLSSEEEIAPKPRAKRAAVKKPILMSSDSEDDQLGDVSALVKGVGDASAVSTARPLFSSKPTAPAKKPTPKKAVSIYDFDEGDENDFAPPPKPAARSKPEPKKAAAVPAKKAAAPAKPAAPKPRAKKILESEDDESDMDLDLDIDRTVDDLLSSDIEIKPKAAKPKAAAPPAKKAAAPPPKKAAPPPKSKPAPVDEESSPPVRARTGRAAAAKAKYRILDSDEDEEEDEESEDSYGDDDGDD